MRERQMKQDSGIKAIGITPAYAGKTEAHSTTTSRVKDHPRVCGKDCKKYDVVSVSGGSPPRMRERRKRNRRILTKPGITPAYAGKTKAQSSNTYKTRDHPRVCGKDLPASEADALALGSPPRMRERLSNSVRAFI